MTPLIQQAVGLAPEPETAMWFDVGQLAPAQDTMVPIDTLMHLPFKRTGVAGIDTKGRKFSMWMLGGDRSVTVAGCTMDSPVRYFAPFAYIKTDEGLRYYNNDIEVSRDSIMPAFRMAVATLSKLERASVGYRPTARPTFINRKRQSKGKPPLTFDWVTVEIGQTPCKNEPQGGTHASPRLHDRRGHWRTYKATGKRVWVRSCKVGDASIGVIFHDYEVLS